MKKNVVNDTSIETLSASDWDNRDVVSQCVGNEYMRYVNSSRNQSNEFFEETEPKVHQAVELHPYSYLAYGKKSSKMVLPACRPVSKVGQFIMVGPEIRQIFCAAGKEYAYVVWQRLQEFDLMHHQVRDGVWFTGAKAIKISELQKSFPTRSEKWVRERIREIEEVVGMYKETRRDSLNNEQQGHAHFPFMLYHPDERTYFEVDRDIENLHDVKEHIV